MYPYGAAVNVLAAGFCVALAARHGGRARGRWLLLTVQFAMLSLSLWVPTLHLMAGWPSTRVTAWLISGFASTSFMFCLLPLSALAESPSTAKRVLDAAMTLILCGLNFLTAFSTGPSGFSNRHLQVSFTTVVFLLISAEATRRAASTEAQRQFAGLTTVYLASRVVIMFLINIVDNLWLATPRELPFDLFYGMPQLLFAALAMDQLQTRRMPVRKRAPNALWASVLPSFVLIASVVLALHIVQEFPLLCSLSIGVSVVCFVLRTHLLYQRMMREQQALIVRTGQLETLASNDPLTGIGNRRWFEEVAFGLLQTGPERRSALLLIDTDGFKQINDTFGHRVGDELLITIAETIEDQMSAIDGACCARIGGDEFAVLLPDVAAGMALEAAERFRKSVATIPSPERACRASVSVGVAVASGRVPLSSLLELADEALYRAKGKGRNTVELQEEDAVAFTRTGKHSEKRLFRGSG
jgi:diguanylate cyclase (GGDEF)-like protein